MSSTNPRLPHLAAALLTVALVLAACGDDGSDAAGSGSAGSGAASATAGASADAEHNDADIAFASGMVPHHEGAIEMARLAPGRAADPRVLELASRIEAAQGPEMDTLDGWLVRWGADGDGGMDHSSMGHGDMGGTDMTALMDAAGAEFDRLFLEQMIVHHLGAVEMAETELAEGRNSDALTMAETIRDTQTGEIAEMEPLLTELGG